MLYDTQVYIMEKTATKNREGIITHDWVEGLTFWGHLQSAGISPTYFMAKEEFGNLGGATHFLFTDNFPEIHTAERVKIEGKEYEVKLICPYITHVEVVLKRVV